MSLHVSPDCIEVGTNFKHQAKHMCSIWTFNLKYIRGLAKLPLIKPKAPKTTQNNKRRQVEAFTPFSLAGNGYHVDLLQPFVVGGN